jgi:hypothetical protein
VSLLSAYQFYRDDHEAFKPLKQYHQLAKQQGTTLDKALGNYMGYRGYPAA